MEKNSAASLGLLYSLLSWLLRAAARMVLPEWCSIQATQVFSLAKSLKMASGIVFVHLVSAFASVARAIVIPDMPESEEQWVAHLANIGHSRESAADIVT